MIPSDRILLERNKLLHGIDLDDIGHILEMCSMLSLGAGERLLDIGQKNDTLYLLLEGELHVYLDSNSLTEHTTLGPGECVGELSLIDGGSASALVIVAKHARMLVMPHDQVWSLVDSSHAVARNLLGILAGRIRNDNLLQLTTDDSLEFEIPDNVDALTGLHNRRWMDDAFPRLILRCERDNLPLCLLLVDLDRFSDINGTYGRPAGDVVLKGVARIMTKNIRPQDLLACLGGDRFAILLPETSPDVAMKIAERLREAVASSSLLEDVNDGQGVSLTASIGVALMQSGDTLSSIFAVATEALSQSRASDFNRVALITTRD
jgi:diguanylate cyclase (GGDEF)-like protein